MKVVAEESGCSPQAVREVWICVFEFFFLRFGFWWLMREGWDRCLLRFDDPRCSIECLVVSRKSVMAVFWWIEWRLQIFVHHWCCWDFVWFGPPSVVTGGCELWSVWEQVVVGVAVRFWVSLVRKVKQLWVELRRRWRILKPIWITVVVLMQNGSAECLRFRFEPFLLVSILLWIFLYSKQMTDYIVSDSIICSSFLDFIIKPLSLPKNYRLDCKEFSQIYIMGRLFTWFDYLHNGV